MFGRGGDELVNWGRDCIHFNNDIRSSDLRVLEDAAWAPKVQSFAVDIDYRTLRKREGAGLDAVVQILDFLPNMRNGRYR